jgi:hypothetical protein
MQSVSSRKNVVRCKKRALRAQSPEDKPTFRSLFDEILHNSSSSWRAHELPR